MIAGYQQSMKSVPLSLSASHALRLHGARFLCDAEEEILWLSHQASWRALISKRDARSTNWRTGKCFWDTHLEKQFWQADAAKKFSLLARLARITARHLQRVGWWIVG